jgi:ABC-type transport system involved in multi-copper enzyme maturation permease subunit
MVVHFVFLTIILLKAFEAQGLNIGLLSSIRWGLILLFLSYSSSFLANYIGKGEYKSASEKVLLLQPYGRIVVMHLTILLGTAIIWLSGPSIVLLVLLVLFKMIADLVSQLVARRNKTARG